MSISRKNTAISLIYKFLILYSLENPDLKLEYITNKAAAANLLDTQTFTNGQWRDIIEQNANKNKAWNDIYVAANAFKNTVQETLSGFLTNAANAISAFVNEINLKEITTKTISKLTRTVWNQ